MPIQKALIALDGSKLAEQALLTIPFLQALGFQRVELVSVFVDVPGSRAPSAEYDEFLQKSEATAGAYLREKAQNLTAGDLEATYTVRYGLAAEEIANEADNFGADLIVITSHGRVGPDRWSLGSVADKVLRYSKVPVLMVGPHAHLSIAGFRPRRVMVPLDGSPMAEVALAPARTVAARTGAELHLVRVVTSPDRFVSPFAPVVPLDDMDTLEHEAQKYLAQVEAPENSRRTVLRAGFISNVSDELVRYCGNTGVDLAVITSHTRVGASRLILGGIADDLLRGSTPVLVVKPGEANTSSLFASAAEQVTA